MRRMQAISGPVDRLDQLLIERPIDLGSQAADVSLDDVGLGVEMKIPYALEQHRTGDDLLGISHEELEQTKFTRQQFDRLAAPCHLASDQIHLEIGHLKNGLFAAEWWATEERIDSRRQFGESE